MNFKKRAVLSLFAILTISQINTQQLFGQEEGSWSTDFILPGVSGPAFQDGNKAYINDVIFADEGVYITGSFTAVEDVQANNIAFWDGNEWHALGTGIGFQIASMDAFGKQLLDDDQYLYVVGSFDWAGSTTDINNIAVWDKVLETWSPLGAGVDSVAYSIAKTDTSILVGGVFTKAGENKIPYLASWNDDAWAPVSEEATLDGPVFAIEVINDVVVIGGDFIKVGEKSLIRLAQFDGENWFDFAGGSNGPVYDIHPIGDSTFVGGNFSKLAGSDIANLGFLGEKGWENFESGPDSTVRKISGSFYNDFMIGGDFQNIGEKEASGLAHWNGKSWTEFKHIDQTFGFGGVHTITELHGNWIIGGNFNVVDSIAVGNIAKLNKDTFSWSLLSSRKTFNGINGDIHAIAVDGEDVYVAGTFITVGAKPISHIAKWDGSEWSSIGKIPLSPTPIVRDLLIDGDNIYITGFFSIIDETSVGRIAVYNKVKEEWSTLSTSGISGFGTSLAMYEDTLVVGGGFNSVNGQPAKSIAGWDINNETWIDFDLGFNNTVWDVAVQEGFIFAGGSFTAGGDPEIGLNRISKWFPETQKWANIGSVDNSVHAIHTTDSVVYYGGSFKTTQMVQTQGVAAFNQSGPEFYKQLGDGIQGVVNAFTSIGDTLYAGGNFSNSGPVGMFRVGAWDGAEWSPLGQGIKDGYVRTLATDGKHIYVGGSFTKAGDGVSRGIAKWTVPTSQAVSNEESDTEIATFTLNQNYPNPFNPSTNISFSIASADQVSLAVFNILGQKVATIMDKRLNAGSHSVSFNASSLSSGVYIYRLDTSQGSQSKRMLIIK